MTKKIIFIFVFMCIFIIYSVYNWETQQTINTFENKSFRSTKITSLALANEYDETNIIVGSGKKGFQVINLSSFLFSCVFIDDGTIKVWGNVLRTDAQPKIVAAWSVIPESLETVSREKGGYEVYTEWLDETKLVN